MQHYASIVTFLEARIHFVIAQIHEMTWKTYCKYGFFAKARSFSKSFPVTSYQLTTERKSPWRWNFPTTRYITFFLTRIQRLRISKFPTYVIGTLIICEFCNDKLATSLQSTHCGFVPSSEINVVRCVGSVQIQIEIKKVGVRWPFVREKHVSLQREYVSLWRRAYARNVRLYYPYRQYTNLFIFRFVPSNR